MQQATYNGSVLGLKCSKYLRLMFCFLYIQFILFRTKNLQSPGTYIFKRTWDPSQKAITK